MVVAVPARDEASCIRECIGSIDEAAAEVHVPVLVVVAADACGDDTADVARGTSTEFCELAVIEGTWGRAGASRAAAVRHALERRTVKSGRVWIANTDADCLVPRSWLRTQLELAAESDAVAGIVELDPLSTAPAMFDAFTASYVLDGDQHRHVHGANIGLSDNAYLAAGGWCLKTVVGEDHVLWNSLKELGHRLRQTTTLRVITSARTRSRVVGGFATNLDNLDSQLPTLLTANV